MTTDLTPNQGMIAAAKKGLKLVEAGFGGSGLMDATLAWARKVANGEKLTPDKVRKMNAWHARHASDKKPGWDNSERPSPGYVANLLWFGAAGKKWAEKKVASLDNEKGKEKEKSQEKNSM